MKRAQRKSNLKKLLAQNDNVEKNLINEQNGRRQLRSAKSSALTGISNYLTKDQGAAASEEVKVQHCVNTKDEEKVSAVGETNPAHAQTCKRRVNLSRFIFKNKNEIPVNVLKAEHDSDDFETPVKKIKRAPKLSQPTVTTKSNTTNNVRKTKRQQKITTAFLRNEQMFSEVAAQHSMAENFNPDEVQLALALSRSEAETDITTSTAAEVSKESTVSTEENIRCKLQKFGFRTATKEDYSHCFAAAFLNNQRRTKTKWANKFTALTLRDPKVQSKKLNANVEVLLKQQFKTKSPSTNEYKFEAYSVKSTLLSQCAVIDKTAQIFHNLELQSTAQSLERYFVTELFPVTQLPAGHLLKNWTIIPGRDLSPERGCKRISAQARKFQKFYDELEACFSNKIKNLPKECDKNMSSLEERPSKNSMSINELDGLLELIENTEKECVVENAVHLDKKQCLSSPQTPVESVELRVTTSSEMCQNSQTQTQTQTRSTSPDLFADSDSDDAEIVEDNILSNITTYEVYSSDDVKNSSEVGCKTDMLSVKADEIVDLTQDDGESPHVDSNDKLKTPTPKKLDISKSLDYSEIPNEARLSFLNTTPTLFQNNEDIQKETVCNTLGIKSLNESVSQNLNRSLPLPNDSVLKFYESCSFGNSIVKDQELEVNSHKEVLFKNNSTASIDLTQSDEESTGSFNNKNNDEDDDDDVCVLLSDDEVNYSIMKADEAYFASPTSSVKISHNNYQEENFNQLERSLQMAEEHNFSVLDLIDVERSFQIKEPIDQIFIKNNSFDLSGDIEPISKEFLASQRQDIDYPTTPTKEHSISYMLKQQRAEFGILESQSEPFSQTPPQWMNTPVKVTPKKGVSPSSPNSHELQQQQYSRRSYSKKFQSFLYEAQKTPKRDVSIVKTLDFDDFDEFDRLVYGSPPKRIEDTVQRDVPAGLTQLLTAEISMNGKCFTTPRKSPSSAVLEVVTPEKAAKILTEEEITINNHVYTVRVTNSPKPDFAAQSDAELLRQLYNFGIKPLKRNQAAKLLEYIYNETHPIMEPVICNDRQAEVESNSDTNLSQEGECDPCDLYNVKNTEAKKDCGEVIAPVNSKKLNLQDCNGDLLLRFSSQLCAELRNTEEVYIFQTNITKKTQQPLLPLHVAWYNLICSNTALHENVLMYEPIDLQEVYLFLKSLGYRYDPKDLKSFFDSRCIIFRYDLTPPEKQGNRHVRKPSKKKTNNIQKGANSQRNLHQYLNL